MTTTTTSATSPPQPQLTPYWAGRHAAVAEGRAALRILAEYERPVVWRRPALTIPANRAGRVAWLTGYVAGLIHVLRAGKPGS